MDITISYLSLACAPYGQPSKHDVLARARAAAGAGLKSVGVDFGDLPHLRANKTEILSLVKIPECEWVDLGTERPYGEMQAESLRVLAGEFGCTRVNCGVCDMLTRVDQAARNLERLASDAAALGMTVAVEPVAFGSLPFTIDIDDMLTLAGRPANAGILVDCWQVSYRGEMRPRRLPFKPVWPVAEIQLCGPTRSGPHDTREASQDRMSLRNSIEFGSWSRDIRTWLAEFNTGGAPVSYEVPRTDWRQLPLEEVARLVADDIKVMGN
jgi:hypothetical protein